MVEFYNRLAREQPNITISKVNSLRCVRRESAIKKETFVRKPVTAKSAAAIHANHLIKMYYWIRIREEGLATRITQKKFDRSVRHAKRLIKKVDKFAAMRYINNEIKKLNSVEESKNAWSCQNYESCDKLNTSSLVDYTYVKD